MACSGMCGLTRMAGHEASEPRHFLFFGWDSPEILLVGVVDAFCTECPPCIVICQLVLLLLVVVVDVIDALDRPVAFDILRLLEGSERQATAPHLGRRQPETHIVV